MALIILSYSLIAIVLLLLATYIYYEVTLFAWNFINKCCKQKAKSNIFVIILFAMLGHILAISTYAIAYYISVNHFPAYGALDNLIHLDHSLNFFDNFYFSASTYTSLGYGDITPIGPIRILAVSEAIVGLVLIAWSASSCYLVMEDAWKFKKQKQD